MSTPLNWYTVTLGDISDVPSVLGSDGTRYVILTSHDTGYHDVCIVDDDDIPGDMGGELRWLATCYSMMGAKAVATAYAAMLGGAR